MTTDRTAKASWSCREPICAPTGRSRVRFAPPTPILASLRMRRSAEKGAEPACRPAPRPRAIDDTVRDGRKGKGFGRVSPLPYGILIRLPEP
jgi:hypothetical protein